MSLMRAFTTRLHRATTDDGTTSTSSFIGRAASQRGGKPVLRAQISSPTALVSTTNTQVRSAYDIAGTVPIDIQHVSSRSASSSSLGEDSDDGASSSAARSTREGPTTDASSVSSTEDPAPEPNHLSCYFKPTVDTCSRSPSLRSSCDRAVSDDSPKIPQRVPSHSKRAHETLHRKRSIQRMMSPSPSPFGRRSPPNEFADVVESSRPAAVATEDAATPFTPELAQLDQIAEEFGQAVHSAEADAEAAYLDSRGLACLAVEEYEREIWPLVVETFGVEDRWSQEDCLPGWI